MNITHTRRCRQWIRASAFAVIAAVAGVSAMMLSYIGVESYMTITALK